MPIVVSKVRYFLTAVLVASGAVWLFFAARLSSEIEDSPRAGTRATGSATNPTDSVAPMDDAVIRELRLTAERAARDTLLTR